MGIALSAKLIAMLTGIPIRRRYLENLKALQQIGKMYSSISREYALSYCHFPNSKVVVCKF
jgi:hypothetical protein